MDTQGNMMPVEVNFTPEGNLWLAQCESLGVMTQGNSFAEAQKNLAEALLLFVESCLRRGVLEQVLHEAGYEPVKIKAVQEYVEEYIPRQPQQVSPCHV